MYSILVCDDDKEIVEAISIYLLGEGYRVFKAYRGNEVLDILEKESIDLIILDIMMPGDNGLKTTIKIREKWTTPIIILSAKSEYGDKILGLNIGADDYLTKPFNPLELIARVKSIIRRDKKIEEGKESSNIYTLDDLVVDDEKKIVTIKDEEIKLTPIEYKILFIMIKNKGRVYSAAELYREVWEQDEAFGVDNTIAVHIRHLRSKIEADSKDPKYIKVVWGVGYKVG